ETEFFASGCFRQTIRIKHKRVAVSKLELVQFVRAIGEQTDRKSGRRNGLDASRANNYGRAMSGIDDFDVTVRSQPAARQCCVMRWNRRAKKLTVDAFDKRGKRNTGLVSVEQRSKCRLKMRH